MISIQFRRRAVWYGVLAAFAGDAAAEINEVQFPESYRLGIHYATVERGNIREELYASRDAIEAAKAGNPLPSGTVLTMEDFRSGQLYRYVVMEKRDGWGEKYPASTRTGDWQFQSFEPDASVKTKETLGRCMGCHLSERGNDFVFTYERLKNAVLQ